MSAVVARRALLDEQASILSRLEQIAEADESRLASSGPATPDADAEGERAGLLARLGEIASGLRAAPGADGDPLEEKNRERARALVGRTGTLLESLRIRRELLRAALGELRDGKRLLEALRAGGTPAAGLDLRR